MSKININNADVNVEFEETATRQGLISGESIKSLVGKIKKWLSDLKTVAFTGSYNDLNDKPDIPSAITVDSALSDTSENPVQNKVIKTTIDSKADTEHTHSVGGTNLILNSDVVQTLEDRFGNEWYDQKIYFTTCYDDYVDYLEVYTLQIWAKPLDSAIDGAFASVIFGDSSVGGGWAFNRPYSDFKVYDDIDGIKRYVITVIKGATDKINTIRVISEWYSHNGCIIYKVKLERGEIPTDWCPAPENVANVGHTHSKSEIVDFPVSLPANGGNADTINGHSVNADVPENAVFTDTIYEHPTGSGFNHIPSGGSSGQILKWSTDGTAVWDNESSTGGGVRAVGTGTRFTFNVEGTGSLAIICECVSKVYASNGTSPTLTLPIAFYMINQTKNFTTGTGGYWRQQIGMSTYTLCQINVVYTYDSVTKQGTLKFKIDYNGEHFPVDFKVVIL